MLYKRVVLLTALSLFVAFGDTSRAEITTTPVVVPAVGSQFVSVIAKYRSTAELSCPSGYVPVLATCNGGVNVVLNYVSPPPIAPVSRWVYYLTSNGVHCETGSAYTYSQIFLRCSREY